MKGATMLKKYHFALIFFILALFGVPLAASADSADFSIKKVDSAEQIHEADFYNMLVSPQATANLVVNINNNAQQSAEFTVRLHNGVTNDNGQVVYSKHSTAKKGAPSLTDLNSATKTITIAANRSQDVTIPIIAPSTATPGIILGAIHVEKKDTKNNTATKGAQIINHFAMEIPVVVRTMPASTPKFDLQLQHVTLGLDTSKRPAILAKLDNNSNWVLAPLKIDTQVYRVGNSSQKYVAHYQNREMAPNSSFNSSVTPQAILKPGKYRLMMTAKSGKQVWHFDKYFTINQAAITKASNNAIKPPKKASSYLWIIIGFLLLLLIILYLVYKLHQKNKALKQNAE
ncbi:DUF3324 domain-containing protein [Lactobacillus curvatus]|nr:DUF3324 domain-containing protein [Latilactobacillus curvatus]MSE24083.1 DUF3324 domain-containing protein [Latilactobacillus curvatus]